MEQLVIKYGVNEKTIRRDLEWMRYVYKIAKYKESFVGAFEEWYEKYKDIVNERVQDKRIKHKTPPYMRPRLRSAYRSVRRNIPLLWTFYDHPETGLPNTNNALEDLFSDLNLRLEFTVGLARNIERNCVLTYNLLTFRKIAPNTVGYFAPPY